jgi:hypothetical protein
MRGAQISTPASTDFGQERATGITGRTISVLALTESRRRFPQSEWKLSPQIGAPTQSHKFVGDFAISKRDTTAHVKLGQSSNVAVITRF